MAIRQYIDNNLCCICIEPLFIKNINVFTCSHIIHSECNRNIQRCPMCRTLIKTYKDISIRDIYKIIDIDPICRYEILDENYIYDIDDIEIDLFKYKFGINITTKLSSSNFKKDEKYLYVKKGNIMFIGKYIDREDNKIRLYDIKYVQRRIGISTVIKEYGDNTTYIEFDSCNEICYKLE